MAIMAQTTNLPNVEEPYKQPKESLLSKYDIPVQFLDYSHIEKCQNGRELEKILHILKSGQEGYFPDLIEFTEKKLEEIKPNSKLLRKLTSVLQKTEIDSSEWKHLSNDLTEWVDGVKKKDQELEEKKANHTYSDCEVRATKELTQAPSNSSVKRIASTDYKSWDKYDPDTEILKMDIHDEKIKEGASKKVKPKQTKSVKFKEFLTETEAEFEANREKERGNECFKAGELQTALQHYSNSITNKPLAAGYTNRALVLYKLKRYKLAIEDCKQALKLEPFNFKAHFRLAQNYEALQQFEQALMSVVKSIEVDPNNKIAQEMATRLHKKCGQAIVKNTRLMIEDIETKVDNPALAVRNTSSKKATKSILKKKKGEIIPIPGTSKMPPPYYKVVYSSDLEVIKREQLKIYNKPSLLHITIIDIDSDEEYYAKELSKNNCKVVPASSMNKNVQKKQSKKKEVLDQKESVIKMNKDIKDKKKTENQNNEKVESATKMNKDLQEEKDIAETKMKNNEDVGLTDIKDKKKTENQNNEKVESATKMNKDLQEEKDIAETKMKNNEEVGLNKQEAVVHVSRGLEEKNGQDNVLQENLQHQSNNKHTDVTNCRESNMGGGDEPSQEFRTPTEEEINSPFGFTQLWYSIRKDTSYNSHANILKLFNFNRIDTVIGYKLDDFILSSIINCLHKHFMIPSEINRVHSALVNIIKIPRFTIAFMFLDTSVKIRIRNLIEFLDQHDSSLPDHVKKDYL